MKISHIFIGGESIPEWIADLANQNNVVLLHIGGKDVNDRVLDEITEYDVLLLSYREYGPEVKKIKEYYGRAKNPFGVLDLLINIDSDKNLLKSILSGYYSLAKSMSSIYRAKKTGLKPASPISRRDFFRLPKTVNQFCEIPIVDDGCLAYPSCSLCIDNCPVNAINIDDGKASIDDEKCISCGLCISSCPHFYIIPPFPTTRQVRSFIKGYGINTKVPVIFLDQYRFQSLFKDIIKLIDNGRLLILFIVPYIGYASLEVLAYFDSNKFSTYVFVGEDERNKYLSQWISELSAVFQYVKFIKNFSLLRSDYKIDKQGPELNIWNYLQNKRNMAEDLQEIVYLPYYYLSVDAELCTLCGVCERYCPYPALKIIEEEEVLKLSFNPLQCRGCGVCVEKCPENAISLSRSVESMSKIVAESDIAHCRICGKPIGPRKILINLEKKLRSKGLDQYVEYIWLCDECKDRAFLKSLFEK